MKNSTITSFLTSTSRSGIFITQRELGNSMKNSDMVKDPESSLLAEGKNGMTLTENSLQTRAKSQQPDND